MLIQTNRVRSISPALLVGLAVSMLGGCAGHQATNARQAGSNSQVSIAAMQAEAAGWTSAKITANCAAEPCDFELSLLDGTKESAAVDRYPPKSRDVTAVIRLLPGTSILELDEGVARVQRARIVRVKPKRVTLGQNAGMMDITAAADRNTGNQYVALERTHGPNNGLEVILNSNGSKVLLSAEGDYAEIKMVDGVDTITKKSLTALLPNDDLIAAINRLREAMR